MSTVQPSKRHDAPVSIDKGIIYFLCVLRNLLHATSRQ